MHLSFLLLFFWQAEPLLSPKKLARKIEQTLDRPDFEAGFWGVVVYAPSRNKILYRRNADKNFRPASNQKILTTLLAFEMLGLNYQFETNISHTGTISEGTLHGDLVIQAGGDPSLSGAYSEGAFQSKALFEPLFSALRQKGITQIRGSLLGLENFFDAEALAPSWEWSDIGHYYGVPVTGLSLNNGLFTLQLMPDQEPLVTPQPPPGFELQNALTRLPDLPNSLRVRREWGTNYLILQGNLPPCQPYKRAFSVWNPTAQFLERLKTLLAEQGVRVRGTTRVIHEKPEQTTWLTVLQSPQLHILAQTLMRESQNHYADAFFKTTAKHVTGEGSFEAGGEVALAFLAELQESGPLKGASFSPSLIDGSGLSAQNNLSPLQIAAMLEYASRQRYWPEWLESFPTFGQGTLKDRGSQHAKGRVFAKTGYIFRTRSLSGYVRTRSDELLVFAMVANQYGCPTSAVNRAQDEVCDYLTRLRPKRFRRAVPE